MVNKRFFSIVFFLLIIIILGEVYYLVFPNQGMQVLFTNIKDRQCAEGEIAMRYTCWERHINSALRSGGIDETFNVLAQFYESDPLFAKDCHPFTHIIGENAYLAFASGKDIMVSPKTTFCGYGFFHGFMESLLQATGDMKEARLFCEYAAKKFPKNTFVVEDMCYHGVGHGFVDGSDPRGWGDDQALIDPGLQMCERIAIEPFHAKSCATGVFNALALTYINGEYGLSPNRDDPFAICRAQKEDYNKIACYEQMNTLLFHLANNNFSRALAFVEGIKNADHARFALRSLSAAAGYYLGLRGDDQGLEACQALPRAWRLTCIEGYAGGLMENGEPEREYVRAGAFCSSSKLTREEREICWQVVLSSSQALYTSELFEMICANLSNDVWTKKEYCKSKS